LRIWSDGRDGRPYELYDGEVLEIHHQFCSTSSYPGACTCARGLRAGTRRGRFYAPLDIVLTEFDVVQPDLLLFTRDASIYQSAQGDAPRARPSPLKSCRRVLPHDRAEVEFPPFMASASTGSSIPRRWRLKCIG